MYLFAAADGQSLSPRIFTSTLESKKVSTEKLTSHYIVMLVIALTLLLILFIAVGVIITKRFRSVLFCFYFYSEIDEFLIFG